MFIQISEFKMHYNYSIGLDNTAEKNILNNLIHYNLIIKTSPTSSQIHVTFTINPTQAILGYSDPLQTILKEEMK